MTEETKATIPEIQALYGEHAAGILNRLRDQYEEIATAKPEIQQAPPTEVLERQTHDVNIDAVVPDVSPDVIMPPAKGSS